MRHWTFWEWVAYGVILVSALILAADQGFKLEPDLMRQLPEFFHSAWWGFAPLVLVVIATIILLLRAFVLSNDKSRQDGLLEDQLRLAKDQIDQLNSEYYHCKRGNY
jgi:hypothetical protein